MPITCVQFDLCGCFLVSMCIQFDRVFLMDSDSFLLNDADSVFCNVPMLGDTAHLDDMTRIHDVTRLDGGKDYAAVPPTVGGQALRRFGYAAATERKPPPKQVMLSAAREEVHNNTSINNCT